MASSAALRDRTWSRGWEQDESMQGRLAVGEGAWG